MEADYIVIGAGAAGCALASRIVQQRLGTVLLVEAGGRDRDPRLHVPMAFHLALQQRRLTHRYAAQPVMAGGSSETWVRGRVLGGSTAINGMVYARGEPADYDALEAAGNPGWGWADMLPIFLAMEDHGPGDGSSRGPRGPLPITTSPLEGQLPHAVIQAAVTCGLAHVEDVNASSGERIGSTPSTIRNGRRVSAARAFLADGSGPALRVLTSTTAGHLLFDGSRVVGVRVRRRGSIVDLCARREVLLAAGTLESPLLLERSGIGRPEVLHRAGVELRVEQPHVGERVVEQRAMTVKVRVRAGLGHNERLATRGRRLAATVRYLGCRTGVLARGPFDLLALVHASEEADRPDAQLLVASMSTDDTGLALADHAGLMIQGVPLRPTTRGSVHITGPGPRDAPRVVPRFLETDHDRQVTAGILRRARELLATDPLRDLVVQELAPGAATVSAEDAVGYALATGAGIYHAVGSCAMGPNQDDVVDASLRVRGVEGLRVVDASVLPTMVSGGTAAPTMAVAWRGADLIAGS